MAWVHGRNFGDHLRDESARIENAVAGALARLHIEDQMLAIALGSMREIGSWRSRMMGSLEHQRENCPSPYL